MENEIKNLTEEINDNSDIVIEYLKMILARLDEAITVLKNNLEQANCQNFNL